MTFLKTRITMNNELVHFCTLILPALLMFSLSAWLLRQNHSSTIRFVCVVLPLCVVLGCAYFFGRGWNALSLAFAGCTGGMLIARATIKPPNTSTTLVKLEVADGSEPNENVWPPPPKIL